MKKTNPILFPGLLAWLSVALPVPAPGAEVPEEWREASLVRHEDGRLSLNARCGGQEGWIWIDPERENSLVIRPVSAEQEVPVLVLPVEGEELEVHHLPQASVEQFREEAACLGWLGRDVLEALQASVDDTVPRLLLRMPRSPAAVIQHNDSERVL